MSLKKSIKKGVKAALRTGAAMITGGASEAALYGANKYVDIRTDSAAAQAADAQQRADLEQYYGYDSLADLANAKRKKEAELEQVNQKATGIASLIGKGTTLG